MSRSFDPAPCPPSCGYFQTSSPRRRGTLSSVPRPRTLLFRERLWLARFRARVRGTAQVPCPARHHGLQRQRGRTGASLLISSSFSTIQQGWAASCRRITARPPVAYRGAARPSSRPSTSYLLCRRRPGSSGRASRASSRAVGPCLPLEIRPRRSARPVLVPEPLIRAVGPRPKGRHGRRRRFAARRGGGICTQSGRASWSAAFAGSLRTLLTRGRPLSIVSLLPIMIASWAATEQLRPSSHLSNDSRVEPTTKMLNPEVSQAIAIFFCFDYLCLIVSPVPGSGGAMSSILCRIRSSVSMETVAAWILRRRIRI